MTAEEQEAANERLIQQMMQDEANDMYAQELQAMQNNEDANLPMSNYEKSKLKTLENKQLYGEDAS